MWWKSRKVSQQAEAIVHLPKNYNPIRRFREAPGSRWALRVLYVLLLIALFAGLIANQKPLYCKVEGNTHFPVLESTLVQLGWYDIQKTLGQPNWHQLQYESVLWPLIPYSAHEIDMNNMGYVGPFDQQQVRSWQFRHWLGTDRNGRDLAAGMITGLRYAMMVGVVAMSVATFIGLIMGTIAGYFGNRQLSSSLPGIAGSCLGLVAGSYWGIYCRMPFFGTGQLIWQLSMSFLIFWLAFLPFYFLGFFLEKRLYPTRKYYVAIDQIIMRIIEIVDSVPPLLLILAILPVLKSPSILNVMLIIGLVSWTGIARFIRAEVLKVREQEYIQAVQVMQFSNWRILTRHVLPNSISPVLIVIAFGMASAILAESTISFLGIGLNEKEITWGYLLNQAQERASAWWMAVFPGLGIFLTVSLFNSLGEGLTRAIDPARINQN